MSKGGSGEVKETPEERDVAEISMQKWERYEDVWAPLESYYRGEVQDIDEGRITAFGRANVETRRAFGDAAPKVEAAQANAGAMPGSGRFKMAAAGFARDGGTALGASLADAEALEQDRLAANRLTLVERGQGTSAQALQGMAGSAAMSAADATDRAMSAARSRAGIRDAVATGAGIVASGLRPKTTGPGDGFDRGGPMGGGATPEQESLYDIFGR